jgi:hypothetical protein
LIMNETIIVMRSGVSCKAFWFVRDFAFFFYSNSAWYSISFVSQTLKMQAESHIPLP